MIKFDKNTEFPITKEWQKGQLAVKEGRMDDARDWFDSGIAMVATYSIENNKFGRGTAVKSASAGRAVYERGIAYGIPGREVNGMDVMEVQSAGKDALSYSRKGKGPYILEMKTYTQLSSIQTIERQF